MALIINAALRSLIPPLSPEEYAQLAANLVADGCLEPLIVWQEEQTLLDGHNRYAICTHHRLTYALQEVSLPDLDAAKMWIITHQLGRRNLIPHQMSYFRGKQYNLQKQQGKRTDLTAPHNEGKSQNTAQVLAAQHNVGPATIERDGAYAQAMDTLAETVGVEVGPVLLARDLGLTRLGVKILGRILADTPETVQVVQDALRGPAPAETLRGILGAARCGICHRPLSTSSYVSRGIGPICAGACPRWPPPPAWSERWRDGSPTHPDRGAGPGAARRGTALVAAERVHGR
jgi:hypothetical protein